MAEETFETGKGELIQRSSYVIEQKRALLPYPNSKIALQMLVSLSLYFFLGVLIGPFAFLWLFFLADLVGVSSFVFLPLVMITVAASVLSMVFIMQHVGRLIFTRNLKKIEELESLVAKGWTRESYEYLDQLINLNLKAGRANVADYYSRQLLSLSERLSADDKNGDVISGGSKSSANESGANESGARNYSFPAAQIFPATTCLFARASYHKSWRYNFFPYEDQGSLCLGPDFLEYQGGSTSFKCDLHKIKDISLRKHKSKMYLSYISLSIEEDGQIFTYNITPFNHHMEFVWNIEKIVAHWYTKITSALESV